MRGGGVFSSLLCCLKYSLLKLENIPVYMRIYSRFCFFPFMVHIKVLPMRPSTLACPMGNREKCLIKLLHPLL